MSRRNEINIIAVQGTIQALHKLIIACEHRDCQFVLIFYNYGRDDRWITQVTRIYENYLGKNLIEVHDLKLSLIHI